MNSEETNREVKLIYLKKIKIGKNKCRFLYDLQREYSLLQNGKKGIGKGQVKISSIITFVPNSL